MSAAVTLQNDVKKTDILLVSQSTRFEQRIRGVADAFGYSHLMLSSTDEVSEKLEKAIVQFIVLDACASENQNDVVGNLQVLRYVFPVTPILVVFPKRFDKEILQWIRKSGANFLMSEGEFFDLSRFDFFANQYIGTDYLPVKHGDFKLGSKIEIPLFYFMSANRKYFPIVSASSVLDDTRLEKIRKIGDVYIRRSDLDAYNQYLQANQDQSAKGLVRRCRLQFGEFRAAYLKLVNHLTEEAETSSFEEGKKILEECQKISGDLVTSMMSAGSVFDIISQSVEGEFNCVDRAPERAAIVGYFCVLAEVGDSDKAILAALLADVGLLNMSSEALLYFRSHGFNDLDQAKQKSYEEHPQASINCAAQKKIQLDQVVRDAILYSHARMDGKGFPFVRPEKLSVEAQIIHFVQILDDLCQVHWGKPRPVYMDVLKKLLRDPNTFGLMAPTVIQALKTIE